jgi:DNA topoisomerase IB
MNMLDPQLTISVKKIRLIANDVKKCAKAANLIYVADTQPGIRRIKKGKDFIYFFDKKKLQMKR